MASRAARTGFAASLSLGATAIERVEADSLHFTSLSGRENVPTAAVSAKAVGKLNPAEAGQSIRLRFLAPYLLALITYLK